MKKWLGIIIVMCLMFTIGCAPKEITSDGNVWIKPPNWSVNGNGIVGYGRFLT